MIEYSNHVTAPKWAKFPEYINSLGNALGVSVNVSLLNGFFTHTVSFTIRGENDKVDKFKCILLKSAEDYNNR